MPAQGFSTHFHVHVTLMTFDLRQGHHHSQLASGLLLTKYGSHSTEFTPFNLWWSLTSLKVTMFTFGPNPTHIPNIIQAGHTVPEKCSRQIFAEIIQIRYLTGICPKFSMRNFRPSSTHIPNIIKVGHTVPEIYSGQKITDGGRRTDIWIIKSLPELSSGKTKKL